MHLLDWDSARNTESIREAHTPKRHHTIRHGGAHFKKNGKQLPGINGAQISKSRSQGFAQLGRPINEQASHALKSEQDSCNIIFL